MSWSAYRPLRESTHGEADREGLFRGEDPGSGHGLGEESQDAPGASTTGMELGDFRLLREVGRGGMGVVYEAEQISLRRRCAQGLPFASAIDSRRLKRFKTEAWPRALAA